MSGRTLDPMNDDRFDAELRRLLEQDASQISGAPSRSEMVERLALATRMREMPRPGYRVTPALRAVLVLGLLAALAAGAVAAGSWWLQRNPLVFAPPPAPPVLPSGALVAGTYSVSANTNTPYTLTVPEGWTNDRDGFVSKGDPRSGNGVTFTTWTISHVYSHACFWEGNLREAGSKELLMRELAAQGGHATSGPSEVALGGHPATRLDLTVAASFDGTGCDSAIMRLWPEAGPDESGGQRIFPGQVVSVFIVENGGKITAFMTIRRDTSADADVAELESVLASIRFPG